MSDIVKALNVAQGTFYFYFKSKTEVLSAVIHKNISEAEERLHKAMNRPFKNAGERLSVMITTFLVEHVGRSKLVTYVIRKESNVGIRQKSIEEIVSRITPQMEEVIREGNANGDFKVAYPTEMASSLVGILIHLFQDIGLFHEPERRERARLTLTQILIHSLGAKERSIELKW